MGISKKVILCLILGMGLKVSPYSVTYLPNGSLLDSYTVTESSKQIFVSGPDGYMGVGNRAFSGDIFYNDWYLN
jgi:hypothetical protein